MITSGLANLPYAMDESLSCREAAVLVEALKNHASMSDLATSNVEQIREFLKNAPVMASFHVRDYKSETEIVHLGEIVKSGFESLSEIQYALVPLGVILAGEVIVLKEGIATKRLMPGDFIGLFETAHFLHSDSIRRIGNWSLVADRDVRVLFFNNVHHLKKDGSPAFARFKNYLVDSARKDLVPKPITDLPVLDHIAGKITGSLLEDTVILAHTHVLPSSLALFRHLAQLVGYQNLFVLDKPYSTVRPAARELIQMGADLIPVIMVNNAPYEFAVRRSVEILWDKVIHVQRLRNIRRILILDDGGDLFLSIPWAKLGAVEVAGVEQTQRGMNRIRGTAQQLPAIVSVAGCWVKKQIESTFIGKASVDKMKSLRLLDSKPKVGIIGTGSIGSAIQSELVKIGIETVTYDMTHHQRSDRCKHSLSSIDTVLNQADIVIGSSGNDLLRGVALERVHGNKTMISTSSADVEFFSLLNLGCFDSRDFGTVTINVHPRLQANVLNGGYPINFDRQREWEPAEDIQITRSLLYAGLIQAAQLKTASAGHVVDLKSEWQEEIVHKWREVKVMTS